LSPSILLAQRTQEDDKKQQVQSQSYKACRNGQLEDACAAAVAASLLGDALSIMLPLLDRRRLHDAQAADDLDDFESMPFNTILHNSNDEFLDRNTWDSDDDGI
jgi:hypothetical protein